MSHHGLPRLTIEQINRLLSNGLITCEQLNHYCYSLALAGERCWSLHAFQRLVDKDQILEKARECDQRRRSHDGAFSLLDGIPISIKANIAVKSEPLTAGSQILVGGKHTVHQPTAGYNADVTHRILEECGAILMGITSQDEFGMGSLGTNVMDLKKDPPIVRPTKNPGWLLQAMGGCKRWADEDVVQCIQLPTDAIFEAHANAQIKMEEHGRANKSNSDDDGDDEVDTNHFHYSAGGSSCGGGASVAHGSSIISLGSDTGGSVRLPAAWCGVTGFKPSYGLLSRYGLVAYASSLDTIGILAPSAQCVSTIAHYLTKPSTRSNVAGCRDPTMTPSHHPIQPVSNSSSTFLSLEGHKVGIPEAFVVTEMPQSVQSVWLQSAQILEEHGATVSTIPKEQLSPDILQCSLSAYYVIAMAEASSNLARYDSFRYGGEIEMDLSILDDDPSTTLLEKQYAFHRMNGFGTEVIRRLLCGTSVLSSDRFHTHYEAAAKIRALLTRQLQKCTTEYDLLLVPTTVFPPPNLQQGSRVDRTEMLANDVMTVPFSMAGLPAISIPMGKWSDTIPVPIGMQLVSGRHTENTLIRAATVLERSLAIEAKTTNST